MQWSWWFCHPPLLDTSCCLNVPTISMALGKWRKAPCFQYGPVLDFSVIQGNGMSPISSWFSDLRDLPSQWFDYDTTYPHCHNPYDFLVEPSHFQWSFSHHFCWFLQMPGHFQRIGGDSLATLWPNEGVSKKNMRELIPFNHCSIFFWINNWLVGGFKHFLFSIIYGIILPIDFHIF